MSLVSRAKLSTRMSRILLQPATPIQQSILYSTKITHNFQKTQQLTNNRTQKSSETSSFSDRIKSQNGEKIVRPKPREIPYQAKVANRVDLIGYVIAVHFEKASDGNSFAAILIAQESSGEKETLLIPAVFEGDLAEVVANHVMVNDCVLVSGQLSTDEMRFMLSDSPVKFHVVAENLNFVKGYRRDFSGKKSRVSFPHVEIDKRGDEKIEDEIKMADGNDDDGGDLKQQWKEGLEYAKMKWVSSQLSRDSEAEKIDLVEAKPEKYEEKESDMKQQQKYGDDVDWNQQGKEGLEYAKVKKWESSCVSLPPRADSESEKLEFVEAKTEKCNVENGESAMKKKDGDMNLLWTDLLKNSQQWWDYRDHKSKGRVKEKFPDFKHKLTCDGLWIDDAPDWALSGVEKLEFYKGEDSWKNLVENPKQWWDNHEKKSKGLVEESFPDFSHKVTGDGLWIDNAPDWVLSGLEILEFDVKVIEENGKIGTEKKIDNDRILDLWRDLVKNSLQWWDFRDYKLNGVVKETSPDFEHKVTRDGLWIKNAPDWVLSELKKTGVR